jgi:hypothetical protein
MEDQGQAQAPVTYVGGLGEPPKGRLWPYLALGLLPVIAGLLVVALWSPIQAFGRGAGQSLAPYSLVLESGGWSSQQKIATVPITLSLTVSNADQRTIQGITLRFTKIDPAWQIVGAGAPDAPASVNGNSIYFSSSVKPGASTTLGVTLVASRAMDSTISITLSPAHGTTPARIQVASGSFTTTLTSSAKVRDPVDSDAYARLTAIYDTVPPKGSLTVWQIHVANVGPIPINGIRLRFPSIPPGLDLRVNTQATVQPDGQTVQFDTTLVPGGQTVLEVGVTPMTSGHFQIPVLVYLGKSTEPQPSANGGPAINLDITVS